MTRWLKLTAIRSAIAVSVVILFSLLIIWLPARHAKNLIKQQVKLTKQGIDDLIYANKLLNSLPALNQIPLKQIGSIKTYANEADNASKNFSAINLARPPEIGGIFGFSPSRNRDIIDDTNNTIDRLHEIHAYSLARSDLNDADKLFTYHAAIGRALVNLLEYDPVADTANFALDSADTRQRLQSTQDGLSKTAKQLQAARKIYNDSTINEVLAHINALMAARTNLSKDGNTQAWIDKVDSSQKIISANRTEFWNSSTKQEQTKLNQDISNIQVAKALWGQLAVKYKIN